MRQKLFIFLGLAVLIIILIGLNAVSYTQKEKELDSEFYPNRSTYNTGATGTRAFFDLLTETGRKPMRWQDAPAELLLNNKNKPATFVIIGQTRQEISQEDAAAILRWVSEGGRLVLVDREPPPELVKTGANWNITFNTQFAQPYYTTDASDQKQMTTGVRAAKPVQPTIYTKGVNAVQTSAFATSVNFEHLSGEEIEKKTNRRSSKPTPFPTFSKATPKYEPPPKSFPASNSNSMADPEDDDNAPIGLGSGSGSGRSSSSSNTGTEPIVTIKTPTPKPVLKSAPPTPAPTTKSETTALSAPVVHLNADGRNVLVDVPYGSGQIVFLSDPYIVANGGINLVDNAQLAVNVVTSREGIIAFDEYHQGYGTINNQLFRFFAGTPVIPVFLQLALILGLIFLSQSRRFARAVPEPEPNRLSKLEYVSAMAELQQRTKGYDLAIENIYTDFRRRVSRLVGVDALKTRKQDLALLIVERLPDEKPDELEEVMQRCEDVMHGDKTGKKEVLRLTTRLREIEEKLGLQRRKRQRKAV
ncbi:MAG TPA: DUF4350 domain-containing protein [Pyrinomonadaceae bacterium]|nr:DUF4350 domain-containing protein [Pyrinomonadaceae bacterium]